MDSIEEGRGTVKESDEVFLHEIRDAWEIAHETFGPDGMSRPFPGTEDLVEKSDFVTLCTWGIFNPFGPTVAGFGLVRVPGTDDALVISVCRHPFVPAVEVRGVIPVRVVERSSWIRDLLDPIFASNGGPELPLLGTLPTHVRTLPGSPLAMVHLKELFFAATPRLKDDLEETCRSIERWPEPVQRAFAETSGAIEDCRAGRPRRAPRPITRATYNRWWNLVTAPDYVKRETDLMEFAWNRAIYVHEHGVEALWKDPGA